MKDLQRISVDNFKIESAVTIEELVGKDIENKIITIGEIFKDLSKIELDSRKLELFLNGVQLTYNLEDELYRIYNNNKFIGLGIVKNKLLKRDIVI